jgi:precorrin-6B methylase 2
MKQTAKRLVSSFLGNRLVWFAVRASLGRFAAGYARLAGLRAWGADRKRAAAGRGPTAQEWFAEKCRRAFPGREVLHGPFRGMKYPSLRSFGSALYPKLLGSYEWELRGVFEAVLRRDYEAVVDVGCAEGYYAVGLGRHFRGARVYAFDTDRGALRQCADMAALNGVAVAAGGFCDREALTGLDLGRRALIISDCEGYENELFDAAVAARLRRHDFLVETHDFLRIDTTRNVLDAFAATHDCEIVESVDDIIKAYTYDFAELAEFTLQERWELLRESRPGIMRWVFASARSEAA